MSNHNKHLRDIFQAAVNSVEPRNLVRNSLSLEGENLRVCGKLFPLRKPCYIVGFGKAVLGMAVEMEHLLGYRLLDGAVVVPTGIFATFAGSSDLLPAPDSRLRFIEGAAGNLPDENAMRGARRIKVSLELNFQVRLRWHVGILEWRWSCGDAIMKLRISEVFSADEKDLMKVDGNPVIMQKVCWVSSCTNSTEPRLHVTLVQLPIWNY